MNDRPAVLRRSVLLWTALGLPTSALFLLLSLRHLDASSLRSSLGNAEPWRLALAVGSMALVYLAQAARWRLIAAPPPSVRTSVFLEWVVGSVAVNNVVPGRPGDLLRAEWLARRAVVRRAHALATVVLDRGLDFATLVGLLVLTYLGVPHPDWLRRLVAATLIGCALLGLVLVTACAYARREGARPAGRLRRHLSDLARELQFRLRGRRALVVAALSLLAWSSWAFGAWLVASSLGISLSPPEALFVTAVINIGVALPSSPGFIGTFQWLSVSALGLLGVGHADAFAFSILMHATWFVPTTVAGAALVLRKLPPLMIGAATTDSSGSHAA